jgi:hypothetical protein
MPGLSRQYSKKMWSKEFLARIADNRRADTERRRHKTAKFTSTARMRFAKKVVEKIKEKMTYNGYSCTRTLENTFPPTEPEEWKIGWPTQNLCMLCNIPCINESIRCRLCDIVCHYNCILSQPQQPEDDAAAGEIDDDETQSGIFLDENDNFEFTCEECVESISFEQKLFKTTVTKLKAQRDYKRNAMIIYQFVITYIEKKRFQKKRKALLLLQSCIRRRIANKRYLANRRLQMRVVVFEALAIPNLTETSLVVITVLDTIKHSQLFRFDKFGTSALTEAILVPGINAHMTLVITICSRKEESFETKNNPYTYVSQLQAVFALRDISNFLETDKYTLNLTDKIRWPVQESSQIYDAHVVNSSQNSHDFLDVKNLRGKDPVNQKITIKYIPQNLMSSLCYQAQAVPLDALKRSADLTVKKTGNNSNQLSRTTRWWLCLFNLKLMFFQFYGDARPRFIGDISSATVHCMTERNLKHNIPIIHADGRKWLVEFYDVGDAIKFEFAVNESQKAYRETKGSMYIRSESLLVPYKDFGHAQSIY